MNIYVPFICLAFGAVINWRGLPCRVLKIFDMATNAALVVLMLVIGLTIGTSSEVMGNMGNIGLNCLFISLSAIAGSVILVVLAEKTVIPLEKAHLKLSSEKNSPKEAGSSFGLSPLVIIMPIMVLAGILLGCRFLPGIPAALLDSLLTWSLIFLYAGVGVSIGSNKEVFTYIKKLGFKILFIPIAIFAGCVAGGFISGLILGIPLPWALLSSGGMGYYSLTGAFMSENFGIEAGTYGFIVNISRDVFTVMLLPLLSKISKGSPIASGAAGCMDTMLVPVTKAVGPGLGMVALISGTVLTFAVPLWLVLCQVIFVS